MTFILDDLRNATFRGVSFLVKNSRITFGQKTVVHEYPNSNRVEVEYLGERAETFSLDIIIKGSGDEYFARRTALKNALLEGANGILKHPYEGEINCSVTGTPELLESDREHGVARFRVDFIKVNEKLFPTETSDNSGTIEKTRDSVEEAIRAWISDNFGVLYAYTYDKAKEALGTLGTLYTDLTDSASIADDKISTVKNTIRTYNNNILKYLSGEDDLSLGLVSLYNSITDAAQSSTDQLTLWYDLFDSIPANPVYSVSTAQRREELNNTDLIYTSAKAQTLANIYNYTPEISFASVDEIDEFRNEIETRYNSIADIDTSIPISYLFKTGLDDPDTAYNLSLLRSEVQKYLDNLENTVGEVITIENVQPTTLTQFVFSQYGTLDNYDQVKELNDILDPTDIKGDLQIII
jgi:prophage DNA circulation protein